MLYWETRGRSNTAATLEAAMRRGRELGIRYIVVASNTGETALPLLDQGFQVVVVSHHVGFRQPGDDEMPPERRRFFAEKGIPVLTTTHLFGNVERAVTNKFGGLYPGGIIAHTLRLFGQGTKVAVEIAVMALDAGLIPFGEEVIAIGGSGRGADTALVLRPAHARDFFDTEILEIICKPRRPRAKE